MKHTGRHPVERQLRRTLSDFVRVTESCLGARATIENICPSGEESSLEASDECEDLNPPCEAAANTTSAHSSPSFPRREGEEHSSQQPPPS